MKSPRFLPCVAGGPLCPQAATRPACQRSLPLPLYKFFHFSYQFFHRVDTLLKSGLFIRSE